MRSILRGSLLFALLAGLFGCNGTKPNDGPPPMLEPDPPHLVSWPRWSEIHDVSAINEMPDIKLRDVQGQPWLLERQKGKVLVVQAGSASSPEFVGNQNRLAEVAKHFPSVTFVTVYGEEAHPELIGHSNPGLRWVVDYASRVELAKSGSYSLKYLASDGKKQVSGRRADGQVVLVDHVDLTRRVEGIFGPALGYGRGAAENPVFVVASDGSLAYKNASLGASWDDLERVLHELTGTSHGGEQPKDEMPKDDMPKDGMDSGQP